MIWCTSGAPALEKIAVSERWIATTFALVPISSSSSRFLGLFAMHKLWSAGSSYMQTFNGVTGLVPTICGPRLQRQGQRSLLKSERGCCK